MIIDRVFYVFFFFFPKIVSSMFNKEKRKIRRMIQNEALNVLRLDHFVFHGRPSSRSCRRDWFNGSNAGSLTVPRCHCCSLWGFFTISPWSLWLFEIGPITSKNEDFPSIFAQNFRMCILAHVNAKYANAIPNYT